MARYDSWSTCSPVAAAAVWGASCPSLMSLRKWQRPPDRLWLLTPQQVKSNIFLKPNITYSVSMGFIYSVGSNTANRKLPRKASALKMKVAWNKMPSINMARIHSYYLNNAPISQCFFPFGKFINTILNLQLRYVTFLRVHVLQTVKNNKIIWFLNSKLYQTNSYITRNVKVVLLAL